MAETIWRYYLPPIGSGLPFVLEMPVGAEPFFVGLQRQIPTLWARVDPEKPLRTRIFVIVRAGQPLPQKIRYVSSLPMKNSWTWHVFEVTE